MPRSQITPVVVDECSAASVPVTDRAGRHAREQAGAQIVATAGLLVCQLMGFVTEPNAVNCSVCPRINSPASGETSICSVVFTVSVPFVVVARGRAPFGTTLLRTSDEAAEFSFRRVEETHLKSAKPDPVTPWCRRSRTTHG